MKPLERQNSAPLLAERIRLKLMVMIASAEQPTEFMVLLETLEVTRGNLSSHLRRLEEAGYIEMAKMFVDRKPKTSFSCTSEGRAALAQYLDELEELVQTCRRKAI